MNWKKKEQKYQWTQKKNELQQEYKYKNRRMLYEFLLKLIGLLTGIVLILLDNNLLACGILFSTIARIIGAPVYSNKTHQKQNDECI